MTNVVTDSAGQIYATKAGDLKIITQDGKAFWKKGAQKHAEGQHGEKSHARFLEEIHQPMPRDDEPAEHDGASKSGGDDRQRR